MEPFALLLPGPSVHGPTLKPVRIKRGERGGAENELNEK